MRWIPVAALLFASVASAADKAEPSLRRGEVFYRQAADIVAKADRANRPALRHVLLGRAGKAIARATDLANSAAREETPSNSAAVRAFRAKVLALGARITKERAAHPATTDIGAQRVFRYKSTVTIERQSSRLVALQSSREAATQTRANRARIQRRDELNRWRLARVADRLRGVRK